jgi:glycosyltransferase involved in cell wall biosynthesis
MRGSTPGRMTEPPLPRLLYLGDVPVEASYHGSALLYRLLQRYPAGRLVIVEGNLFRPATDRRLPGVRHAVLRVGWPRVLNSRLHAYYSGWLVRRARARAGAAARVVAPFAPEAVLTVAHGFTWATAAAYAEARQLPLHLIVHDDWPLSVPAALRDRVQEEFGRVYRQAASRLCVSPFMAEEYARRYGAAGTVLLPGRAPDAEVFDGPAERLAVDGPPVFAFAGTINSPGYARLLVALATQLAAAGGQLRLYGPLTAAQAAAVGLDLPNVRLEGLLSSPALLRRLRQDADVLFVPMSFAEADHWNMRMSFPSKLTDYTTAGLPLLICGPADCSAVRWAALNPGVAEVVTTDDPAALAPVVARLIADREHRRRLGHTAQAVGTRDFSAEAAEAILHAALVA